ncbi:MAG: hypothetical protein HFE90_07390 [Firmicutes bacterium]|nr:hypothetical protein [Bacillota bacterium]
MKLLVFAADAQSGAFAGRKTNRAIHNGIWARTLLVVEACMPGFARPHARNKPEVQPSFTFGCTKRSLP